MGVDFGAILFYGFVADGDDDNELYDPDKELSDLSDEIYGIKTENVQFQNFNRGWSSDWFIIVNESYKSAYNGEHLEFDFDNSYELWHNELIDFCHRYGYKYGIPMWHLISSLS